MIGKKLGTYDQSKPEIGSTPVPCSLQAPCTDTDLQWLQITATATSLIGIIALLMMIGQNSRADDRGGGFNSGSKTFSNPYANTAPPPPTRGGFFDDEDDEGQDFSEGAPPNYSPPPQRPPLPAEGGGAPGGNAGEGNPGSAGETVSAGGGPPGGVISGKRFQSIRVDDETGEGSKEIVTDFNFPDADIMDIAKTLGKLTGKNFILDKEVKGRITIISNGPITVGDAWKAFLTALDINNFALIPSGKYIRIARQRDARDKQLRTYTGESSPDSDALITRVFPLKYIDAEEVARTFRSFMPANSRIIPYEQTNTVIVTDTGSNIAKLNKMLEILDVEGYDVGIEVIPVKVASASELSKLIDTLIPGAGGGPGAPPGAPRFGGTGRFSARRTKEGGVINTIIADERTNALIINANSKGVEQVRELVAKLDQKVPVQTGGGKVHVKYLQFADAEQIANTLNNIASSTGGGAPRPPSSIGGGGTGVNPVSATLFEGSIKIAPDKSTNSLVITASPADFVVVERVVNRLDIPRDEVYVEVVILEVALNKDFKFSSNIAAPNAGIALTPNTDLLDFVLNPIGTGGGVIGFKGPGETTIKVGGVDQKVPGVLGMIKAIQTNAKANVLATPQIIALDNTEANFESTENLPVPQTAAVPGAGVTTTVGKEPVTLSIKITPQINKITNFVKLKVIAKIGDVVDRKLPDAVAALARATLNRTADTTVIVGDGDTVVIGGLIRDKQVETVSKIPLLGDIPLLGWLFRARSSSSEKTNLMIFLTPHIVRQYEKVRAILDRKLKERDEYIESNAGGDDPLRKQRDEIIRNLPDIKELTSKRAEGSVTLDDEHPPAPSAPVENPFTGGKAPQMSNPTVPGGLSTAPTPPTALPGAPPEAVPPGGPVAVPPSVDASKGGTP